ncbi:MAG: carboxypeptidase regulatory-like domain-containing protein [Halothece sp.]
MRWQVFLSLAITLFSTPPALAHGVAIAHRQTSAIEIRATYDNGKPMSNAQVVVYAPNNPAEPWLKGTTTQEGTFAFVPDRDIQGDWDVKVRKSGHGDLISIPIENSETGSPQQTQASNRWQGGNYTPLQKAIMAALGVWGFIGTGLFFARNKSNNS